MLRIQDFGWTPYIENCFPICHDAILAKFTRNLERRCRITWGHRWHDQSSNFQNLIKFWSNLVCRCDFLFQEWSIDEQSKFCSQDGNRTSYWNLVIGYISGD